MCITNVKDNMLKFSSAIPHCKCIRECMCNIEGHGAHPKKESNKCVLDDVTKTLAENGIKDILLVIEQINAVVNSNKEVGEKGVDQESNCYLSKQISTNFSDSYVHTKSDEYEEVREENGCRVK